jgi:hypothetical protein
LSTRYYNPEVGRFLNADAFATTGQGMLGNNMFAYCLNNAISLVDASGTRSVLNDRAMGGNSSPPAQKTSPVEETIELLEQFAESSGSGTITYGLTVSGAFGIAGSASVGITMDRKGNIGISYTVNSGGGFPSVSVGRFVSVNNAPTIYHQEGWGTVVGVSGGPEVIAVGGEYNMLIDQANNTVYHGGTVSVTAGLYPACVEAHGEVGYTWVRGLNIFDVIGYLLGT